MRVVKKAKSVDTKRIRPYDVTVVGGVTYDDSTPAQPVIETFFLGTYSNAAPSEKGTRLFYTYFDLQNEHGDTLDLVGAKVNLDYTQKLQVTDNDPNTAPGELRIFRNFPERWVSSTSPAAGHIPNVDVTGGGDSASGKLNP